MFWWSWTGPARTSFGCSRSKSSVGGDGDRADADHAVMELEGQTRRGHLVVAGVQVRRDD